MHQAIRWTYREFAERVETLARGLLGARARDRATGSGIWSPNYAEWTLLQYATAEIGVILVNINPAYRTHELAYVLDQSGCRVLVAAPSSRRRDYVAMVDEVARRAARARAGGLPVVAGVGRSWPTQRAGATADALDAAAARPHARRPHQHPVHVGHDRVPEGRHAHPPQHPEQRLLHGRAAGLHARPTACASRCPSTTASAWCMGNLGCTTHGATMVIPAEAFDPAPCSQAVEAERVHRALRRAHDVRRRARPPATSTVRPDIAAHRRHGRLAVPGRGDEGVHRPHAHGRGDHLLRHDRDVAGVDPDAARRLAAPPHRDRRARASRTSRSASPTPTTRSPRSSGARPASCAPAATR